MIVTLESVINPDHRFDYNRAIPQECVEVASLEEAQKVCRDYINDTGIGGGNWKGGEVWEDGVNVARISYNGRIWTPDDKEIVLEK
jgi:hypothetical protein